MKINRYIANTSPSTQKAQQAPVLTKVTGQRQFFAQRFQARQSGNEVEQRKRQQLSSKFNLGDTVAQSLVSSVGGYLQSKVDAQNKAKAVARANQVSSYSAQLTGILKTDAALATTENSALPVTTTLEDGTIINNVDNVEASIRTRLSGTMEKAIIDLGIPTKMQQEVITNAMVAGSDFLANATISVTGALLSKGKEEVISKSFLSLQQVATPKQLEDALSALGGLKNENGSSYFNTEQIEEFRQEGAKALQSNVNHLMVRTFKSTLYSADGTAIPEGDADALYSSFVDSLAAASENSDLTDAENNGFQSDLDAHYSQYQQVKTRQQNSAYVDLAIMGAVGSTPMSHAIAEKIGDKNALSWIKSAEDRKTSKVTALQLKNEVSSLLNRMDTDQIMVPSSFSETMPDGATSLQIYQEYIKFMTSDLKVKGADISRILSRLSENRSLAQTSELASVKKEALRIITGSTLSLAEQSSGYGVDTISEKARTEHAGVDSMLASISEGIAKQDRTYVDGIYREAILDHFKDRMPIDDLMIVKIGEATDYINKAQPESKLPRVEINTLTDTDWTEVDSRLDAAIKLQREKLKDPSVHNKKGIRDQIVEHRAFRIQVKALNDLQKSMKLLESNRKLRGGK